MAVYRILKPFKDIYTGETYKKDQEIDITVKRAEEAIKNLKDHGDFLERIDNKETK